MPKYNVLIRRDYVYTGIWAETSDEAGKQAKEMDSEDGDLDFEIVLEVYEQET